MGIGPRVTTLRQPLTQTPDTRPFRPRPCIRYAGWMTTRRTQTIDRHIRHTVRLMPPAIPHDGAHTLLCPDLDILMREAGHGLVLLDTVDVEILGFTRRHRHQERHQEQRGATSREAGGSSGRTVAHAPRPRQLNRRTQEAGHGLVDQLFNWANRTSAHSWERPIETTG